MIRIDRKNTKLTQYLCNKITNHQLIFNLFLTCFQRSILVCQTQKPCNPSQSFSCNELGYGEYECHCKHGYTGQNCDESIRAVTQKAVVQKKIVTDEPVSTGSIESILAIAPDGRGLLDFYKIGDDLEFRKSVKMPYDVVGRPVIVFNGDYSWALKKNDFLEKFEKT